MAVKSPFPPRRMVRPPLPSVAQTQVFREVRTEDELRRALDLASGANALYGLSGRRIVLAAPITLKAPVIVGVPGVLIEAHGGVPLSVEDGVAYAFDLNDAVDAAYQVDLVGINFADPVGNRVPTAAWVNLGVFCTLERCKAPLGGTLARARFASAWHVRGCASFQAVVALDVESSDSNVIASNVFDGDIVIGAGAGGCCITGNRCLGLSGTIITTAGTGGNAVVGNVGFTTTLHGGDAAAGNV